MYGNYVRLEIHHYGTTMLWYGQCTQTVTTELATLFYLLRIYLELIKTDYTSTQLSGSG